MKKHVLIEHEPDPHAPRITAQPIHVLDEDGVLRWEIWWRANPGYADWRLTVHKRAAANDKKNSRSG